jgi:hypothetical protein
MASGVLGRSDLSAATNTSVYTVPSAKLAVVNVSICNRGSSTASVRLAVSTSGTPGAGDYIEYDQPVISAGVLERTGLVLAAGTVLVAYSSGASVSVVAYGFEENA